MPLFPNMPGKPCDVEVAELLDEALVAVGIALSRVRDARDVHSRWAFDLTTAESSAVSALLDCMPVLGDAKTRLGTIRTSYPAS